MGLEILYDIATNEIRAWCGDETQFGNFTPTAEQAVVIWDIEPPTFPSDIYFVDLVNEQLLPNPDYVPPPDLSADAARAEELLHSSPDVITQPEIWELLRIIGRKLGYHF